MREWNPKEMKLLFKEKAEEQGCSLRDYLKTFVNELSTPIHYNTLERYFMDGSKGPKSLDVKISLYEKIDKDFGHRMFADTSEKIEEIYIEDRDKKVPGFCQKKLEEAFAHIIDYLMDAYNGRFTLLFESDYLQLMYYFAIYKPCAPNYLCREIQEFFKNKRNEIKEEAANSGIIIFEDVGFCYQNDLGEGKFADIDDCELAEDYIMNNQEEHRERVGKFMYDIAEFWEKNVERLYPNGGGQAREVVKCFEEQTR